MMSFLKKIKFLNSDKNLPQVNVPEKDLTVKSMTAEEMDLEIKNRIDKIKKEFTDGFDLIKKYPQSVTFFGSARLKEDNLYYKKARSLAGRLSQEGYTVITGGGPGIMEAANRGSIEKGGPSIGLNIKLPFEQVLNPYVDEFVNFNYFFARKVCMTFSSEAYIYFPGGFGTLDEFFEVLTLIQTKKIARRPIILVGVDFWKPFLTWIDESLRIKFNTVDPHDTSLYELLDDEDMIIDLIK
ncbi:MAG: TIGR00730 family Rossman fold protein, partial [Candidatus Paceibacterota bacterium]